MSKIRKTFCILVAALVLVTMTGTGVFAEGETPEQPQATDNVTATDEVTVDGIEAVTDYGEEEGTVDTDPVDKGEGEVSAELIQIDLSDTAVVKVDSIKSRTWTGKAIKPNPTVTAVVPKIDPETGLPTEETETIVLVKGKDYTVGYSKNKNVGTAKVIITGTANADPSISPYSFINKRTVTFKIKKPTVHPVKNVKALAGLKAIKVTWKGSPDADYYYIEVRKGNSKKVQRMRVTDSKETKSCSWESIYRDNKFRPLKSGVKYKYTVYAMMKNGSVDKGREILKKTGNDFRSKGVSSAKTQIVKQMVIKVTMKQTVGALKSGKRYTATGYGGGQYKIKKGNHTYSIARIRVKEQKAIYKKNGKFSDAAVEFFMNGGSRWAKGKDYSFLKKRKFTTSRTYFVWVNTYNQHAYVLKKDGKKWKVVDNWKVSMGTAKTPSPTGQRTIIKFRAHHPGHGAPNWNFITWSNYLQHGTALHGLENGWAPKLGTLASHGCIRNPTEKAGELHSKYSGNGMKVIIW